MKSSLVAFVVLSVGSGLCAAEKPLSDSMRKKLADHIVVGEVLSVTSKDVKAKNLLGKTGLFINTDYTIEIKVGEVIKSEAVEKIKVGDTIKLTTWKAKKPALRKSGQFNIPGVGDVIKVFFQNRQLLTPNGIVIIHPARKKN